MNTKTILIIIENDVFLGDAMMRRLQDDQYQAELVPDGPTGLKKAREMKPSLIIVDSNLPKMSGEQFLSEKLSDASIAAIPTIILMNSDDTKMVSKVLALGAKDYILKSDFNQEVLLSKVRQQLNQANFLDEEAANAENTTSSTPTSKLVSSSLINKKVMWVEDDAFLSEIIARKLSTQGCKLVHAANGDQALVLVEKEKPDIVLLDILLPGMDGFEILRHIKENPATKDIPVILLSNLSQKSDIEKGKQLGAERFLIKAVVSLDEIVGEIGQTIERTSKNPKK